MSPGDPGQTLSDNTMIAGFSCNDAGCNLGGTFDSFILDNPPNDVAMHEPDDFSPATELDIDFTMQNMTQEEIHMDLGPVVEQTEEGEESR